MKDFKALLEEARSSKFDSLLTEKVQLPVNGSEIVQVLFESRDLTHYWHLQTTSYALHKALNAYYDGILDLTDAFLEAWLQRNHNL